MPTHDWTKVPAGIFHHLHLTWIGELSKRLNRGVLPAGYYALGEQVIGGAVPDVLTLERRAVATPDEDPQPVATAALGEPVATITALAENPRYPPRPRIVAVRHVSGDRLVAIVEIVSSGNKKDAAELGALVEKTVATLSKRIHIVLIDLHPPGPFDPEGIHNAVWRELGQPATAFDCERPLQVVSYRCNASVKAFIEPLAPGDEIPEAPLFLTASRFVMLPLAETYAAAFEGLPGHLRDELAG